LDSQQLIERFNERAAIMEYCGGMKRPAAELASYAEVKKLVGRHSDGRAVALPEEIRKTVKVALEQGFLF
jgi:hypothetical protein